MTNGSGQFSIHVSNSIIFGNPGFKGLLEYLQQSVILLEKLFGGHSSKSPEIMYQMSLVKKATVVAQFRQGWGWLLTLQINQTIEPQYIGQNLWT